MLNSDNFDFSFSGLKTFTLNTIANEKQHADPLDEQTRADIAAAFEEAVVDTLTLKCRRALKETGLRQLLIAGGVSANVRLRWEYSPGSELFVVLNETRDALTPGFPDLVNRAIVIKVNRLLTF